MKFGALIRDVPDAFKLGKYLDRQALEQALDKRVTRVSAARDWWTQKDPNGLFVPYDDDALGNNDYGDCVPAGFGHFVNLHAAIGGFDIRVTTGMVLGAYHDLTGFDPVSGAGDHGTYPDQMWDAAQRVGLYGVRVKCSFLVDKDDDFEVAAAGELLGGTFACFDLPETIKGQDIWDVTDTKAKILGKHLIFQHAWSPGLDVGDSWGLRTPWTNAFRREYCKQLWATWCPQLVRGNLVDCGLRVDDVESDLRARGVL